MAIFYRGRHVRPRPLAATTIITLMVVFAAFMTWMTAYGVPAKASESYGGRALSWAETHAAGHWYQWGGTGPNYDCSGLVSTAILRADGIWVGRTTYAMLTSSHLMRIPLSQARRGDILFYGSGHVEFDTAWYHTSFGAHSSGQRIGWIRWGWGWYPTMAFRIR